jgi:ribosomal protein S18 acetylase RimI-like enzyme
LLAYVDEQARKLRLKKCSLLVALHNDNARRVYERVGYLILPR